MKSTSTVASVLMLLTVSGLLAQGFGARPGTWQFTITMKGDMPMQGLPPEVAKELAAQLAKPQTTSSCLTAEDLKELNLGQTEESGDDECELISSKVTATMADFVRECTGDETYTDTAHFEAPTPQTLTGNISRRSAAGTMTINTTGRWVAAACKE
jgi:hypothetical protein